MTTLVKSWSVSDSYENFLQLNGEFQHVLGDIPAELEGFKSEFVKLYNALLKSHEGEQRLIAKSREILDEQYSNQEKIAKLQEEELECIEIKRRLQSDIKLAWAQVSESHQLYAEKQTKLNAIQMNIPVLQEQINKGSGWSSDQESVMEKLRKKKLSLSCEYDAKATEANQLKNENSHLRQKLDQITETNLELDAQISIGARQLAEKKAHTEKETRRKGRIEKQLRQTKFSLEKNQVELNDKLEKIKNGDLVLSDMEYKIKETKSQIEKYMKDYDSLFTVTHRITEEMNEQWQKNIAIQNDNLQQEIFIASKREEFEEVLKQIRKLEQFLDLTKEKINQANHEKDKYDKEKQELVDKTTEMINHDLEIEKKQSEGYQKRIDSLLRERNILQKMISRGDKAKENYDLLKIHENTLKNQELEISGYSSHVKSQRDAIHNLLIDQERYEKEAEIANQKYLTAMEQVKLQEIQMNQIQKSIAEGETKLKQQQNLYEAVRSDRNLYSRNLIESQEEIAEMKRKFKMMNHQIEQLKDEITSKDHSFVKEHFDNHRVEREKDSLKNELIRIKKHIESSEQIITNQEQEIFKLSRIIQEAEEEKQRQLKEYDVVINERDVLGAQLVRRNEELHALYEKIRIQRSTLSKGEFQYNEAMAKLKELKEKNHHFENERNDYEHQLSNSVDLKNQVFRLERELLQERTKIMALSEELEIPLNVHRWRKLEERDPVRYDMIRKITALQKTIVSKTEQVGMKDALIQEKEKLYVELKTILAKKPGVEVMEQLTVYQNNLKEKKQQRKAMNEELQMYKAQVEEYKTDIKQIHLQLQEVTQTWIQKMNEQRLMINT